MLAVHDPRLKGSDASNIHDEEIGEEEVEWSDDEAEAEAKKRKKNKRSDSAREKAWASGPVPGQAGPVVPFAPLPPRPHFDYDPDDPTDAASFYGDEVGETEFDDSASVAVSEAGSSASRRPAPMPYDLDEGGPASPVASIKDERGSQGGKREGGDGGRGRGRGQGRQRGGGRGGGREDKAGRGGSRDDRGGRRPSAGNAGRGVPIQGGRPAFNLPTKPNFDPLSTGPVATLSHFPTPPPSAHPAGNPQAGYNPSQPSMPPSPGGSKLQPQSHYAPPPPNNHYQQQEAQHHHYSPQQQQQQQYHGQQPFPSQPPFQNYPQPPSFPPQHPYPPQQYQHHPPAPPLANDGPAINPRFAAQYQQMQMMSQLAAWGGQGQGQGQGGGPGQNQGQGGGGGYGGY